MKREILFRGKRVDNGKWVEGFYARIQRDDSSYLYVIRLDTTLHISNVACVTFEVIPESVGQFTGLTTKNESPVYYEVEKLFEDQIFTIGKSKTKYRCVFENFEWIGISDEGDKYGPYKIRLSAIKEQIYIIGNIHDNPELLS